MSDKHPDLIIAPSERKTLQTIAGNECHWPYGDPQRPDFYFLRKAQGTGFCVLRFSCAARFRPLIAAVPTVHSQALKF